MWLETFWHVITIICLIWYFALTVYVAARGGPEIIRLVHALRGHAESRDGLPDTAQRESR
jgi:hypothetical protein